MTIEEKQTAETDFFKESYPAKTGSANVSINMKSLTQTMTSPEPSTSIEAQVAVKGKDFIIEAFENVPLSNPEDGWFPAPDYVCPEALCGPGCPPGWVCQPNSNKRKKRSSGKFHFRAWGLKGSSFILN